MFKKYKILNVLLLAVIICSLFVYTGYAEPADSTIATDPTLPSDTQPVTDPTESTTWATESTTQPTEPVTDPTESTTWATESTTQAIESTMESTAWETDPPTYVYEGETEFGDNDQTPTEPRVTTAKTTLEHGQTVTTKTTVAKNINDYGKNFRVVKWIALVVLLIALVAMIVVNVRYKNAKRKSVSRRRR